MRCCCCRQEVGTAAEKGPTSERNRQDRTMMSSGEVLPNHSKSRRVRRFGRFGRGPEKTRGTGDWSICMVGQFNLLFSVLEGGISKGEEGWNVLSNAPPRRCKLAHHPTRPGRGVASLFARAVHLSRGNERKGCETAQGVLMVKWFLPRLSCRRGLASDRRIHGCCVKKAVDGVGAVKICGI